MYCCRVTDRLVSTSTSILVKEVSQMRNGR